MDADSVSHMMHYKHLITDDDYEAISAAPNDSMMNTVILQYVRAMDMRQFISFCNILKDIETQKIIGDHLCTCKFELLCVYCIHLLVRCRTMCASMVSRNCLGNVCAYVSATEATNNS